MKRKLLKNYNIELQTRYRNYRNCLNKLISKQKYIYYKKQIDENKNNMKKIYDIIKDACCEKSRKASTLRFNNRKGEKIQTNLEMANHCNDYFVNIGVEMERGIPLPRVACSLDGPISESMYLAPLTKNELIQYIFSLKDNSSPGDDGITSRIIKDTHLEIITPLLYIINLIFETGKVPSEFKSSVIHPIHKAGDKTDIKNY